MSDVLAEFFDQFSPEEQTLIMAKRAEARGILLQGQRAARQRTGFGADREWALQPQDESRGLAAAAEFVGYQRVLVRKIDPVCTENLHRYLRQLDRICEGLGAKYGTGESADALAEMRADAERLAWVSLGKQLGGIEAGTINAASKPEQVRASQANRSPAAATPVELTPASNARAKTNNDEKHPLDRAGGTASFAPALVEPQPERAMDAWYSRMAAELSEDELKQMVTFIDEIAVTLEEAKKHRTNMLQLLGVDPSQEHREEFRLQMAVIARDLRFGEGNRWDLPPRDQFEMLKSKAAELRARATASILRPILGGDIELAHETPQHSKLPDAGSLSKSTDWEDIELSFVGDHHLEARVGNSPTQRLSYKEITGFEDRRTGKPNQLWAMLRIFAGLPDGTIPDSARTGVEWEATQRKVQRTSEVLRKHFGMTGDPLPYVQRIGYRPRIRVRLTDQSR